MRARDRTAKEKQGKADEQNLNHSLMILYYRANTSLWLIAPRFVKLYIPVSPPSVSITAHDNRSVRIVFEFKMSTTRGWEVILVTKLRGCRSETDNS